MFRRQARIRFSCPIAMDYLRNNHEPCTMNREPSIVTPRLFPISPRLFPDTPEVF